MQQPARQRLTRIAEWLFVLGLVTAAGLLSKLYTREAGGVSTIWLANGLTLGYLLYAPRTRWYALLIASAIGHLLSGALVRDPPLAVLMAMLFNTAEVVVAAWPLRAAMTSARELSRPANFLRFLLYAVLLAPLASGLVLASYLLTGRGLSMRILEGWFVGHVLGMATVAPVMLALCGNELARLFRRAHLLELCGGVLLIVVTTTAVFWQDSYPLLFLIFPTVMLAALRAGFAGTAFALIVVVAISATFTGLGHGPLMLIDKGSRLGPYLLLQTFIAVLLLTCFPVAVTMSALRYRRTPSASCATPAPAGQPFLRRHRADGHGRPSPVCIALGARDPRPGAGGFPARNFPRPHGARTRGSAGAAAAAPVEAGRQPRHHHLPEPARRWPQAVDRGAREALP